jgi:Rieske Fe-S protein
VDGATTCTSNACTANADTLVVSLADHPQLAKPGGSVVLTDSRYTDPICAQHTIIVAQPSAGKFIAFSASCTHACCTVGFTGTEFACPCHGSRYNLEGEVTQGPAPQSLPAVPFCADACAVYLKL